MNKKKSETEELFNTVVKGGYCIGCGACAAIAGSSIKMKFDQFKKLQATLESSSEPTNVDVSVLKVCPFSNHSKNEDEIGKELFGNNFIKHEKLGFVQATYAGYVVDPEFRANGSSGGVGTWILTELYKQGLIDMVAHVQSNNPTPENPKLFQYKVSNTIEEITKGAKSKYYPVELSGVLEEIKKKPGRYAVVGLPCFVKSVRLLTKHDPVLAERIKFCVGLVCGHLKSAHFAGMLSWQVGIPPQNLETFDFRTKLEGHNANLYGITATGTINGEKVTRVSPPVNRLFGSNWGWGLFKYKACDYCDDVVAETADITIGDAWLPKFVKDSQGTNIIIVRNQVINEIIKNAQEKNEIRIETTEPEEVVQSQQSGFMHRREGLAYRLYLADAKKEWRPSKRVQASNTAIDKKTKEKQKLRMLIAEKSHIAFENALTYDSLHSFQTKLAPFIRRYNRLYKSSLWIRLVNKIKHLSVL